MIPAEHRGQARVFRNAVLEADRRVNSALPKLAAPLRRRLGRKPTLRPELLIDASRAWATEVSDQFTCDLRARADKRELTIAELRACGGRWRTERWDEAEWQPGVSLTWVALRVEDGRLRLIVQPAAHLLMHALARRFERGCGRTAADVVRDLRALAAVLDDGAEEVAVPGGRWVGERQTARDGAGRSVSLFHCKTFLN